MTTTLVAGTNDGSAARRHDASSPAEHPLPGEWVQALIDTRPAEIECRGR